MLVIGLMSGTSADGIDAALVEWPDDGDERGFELQGYVERVLPSNLQQRVHALAAGDVAGPEALAELTRLDVELAERFAAAAAAVAQSAGVGLAQVDAIASHGQTVAHHPEHGASLQIGNPCVIAERTGCRVVADFRSGDLAAGGEGAPLAPFFHYVAMSDPDEARAVLNLGGIANLSWLPAAAAPESVIAFDVGPANALLDAAIQAATGGAESFDRDGNRARAGTIDLQLLEHLLEDDYLRRVPPKSTGRERYGRSQAESLLAGCGVAGLDDLLATLAAFTIESVGRACREHLPELPARLLVGGGGAKNSVLMEGLSAALPGCAVEPFDAIGVPADAAEAMAFALLGRNALLGVPNHLPQTTGASRPVVLGVVVSGSRA